MDKLQINIARDVPIGTLLECGRPFQLRLVILQKGL